MNPADLEELKAGLCPLCLFPRDDDGGCAACGWNGDVVRTRPNCLSPGTVLYDRYLVGQPLGQGGFSITYLVMDIPLKLRLCLKEFYPSSAVSRVPGGQVVRVNDGRMEEPFREGLEQFMQEGRVLARLSGKPGIIEVRDLFQINGTAYMVTDLLDGVTFRDYLAARKTVLSPGQILKILMPVMDSLRAVHGEGILHCDISPENVFLTTDGQVRLLDFGSAQDLSLKLAQGRSIVVKPGYAAPEQYRARGRQGAWTDVYGLAATFFRALSGKAPPDALERLEDDPLRALFQNIRPSLAGKWKRALLRAMAIQVGDRFQDVESFQYALCEAAGAEEVFREQKVVSFGSLVKIAGVVVLAGAMAAGGLWYLNGRPSRLLARADRALDSGLRSDALPLLEKAEDKLLGQTEPEAGHVVALCEAYEKAQQSGKALDLVLRFPGAFSGTSDGLYCAARVFSATGREEKALKHVSRAAALDPDEEQHWLLMGHIARSLGLEDRALEAFLKAAEVSPSDPDPLFAAARLQTRLGDPLKGEELYVQALTLAPEEGAVWADLARLRERRCAYAEAARAWERAVRFMPDRPDFWAHLGENLAASGEDQAAAEAFSKVIEIRPADSRVWVQLGRVLARGNAGQEALQALDRAVKLGAASEDVAVLLERGKLALRFGDIQTGVRDLQTVLRREPAREEVWKRLARFHESRGEYILAARVWERALDHVEDRGAVFEARGHALRHGNRYVEGERAFRRALSLRGDRESILLGLAACLMGQGREGEALPYLEETLRQNPASARAHLFLGEALFAEDEIEASLSHLLEAQSLGDHGTRVLLDLGRGHLELEQYSRAVDYFRTVIRDEPNNEKAIRLLEETFYRWGQKSSIAGPAGSQSSAGTEKKEQASPSVSGPKQSISISSIRRIWT